VVDDYNFKWWSQSNSLGRWPILIGHQRGCVIFLVNCMPLEIYKVECFLHFQSFMLLHSLFSIIFFGCFIIFNILLVSSHIVFRQLVIMFSSLFSDDDDWKYYVDLWEIFWNLGFERCFLEKVFRKGWGKGSKSTQARISNVLIIGCETGSNPRMRA
jgi:hypothetical protein